MKKYFYFPYVGGKSKELKYIYKYCDISKYDVIIEPFCGSSAFSYDVFLKDHNKTFILNDINKTLINLLSDIKKNTSKKYINYCSGNWIQGKTTKEEYEKIINKDCLESYFYKNKIYNIRTGLYPLKKSFKFNYNEYIKLDSFYMSDNVFLYNEDYKNIIEKYKDNEKAFIFLDPPYFLSFNSSYTKNGSGFGGNEMSKKEYTDPTKEYIYIRNALTNYKCKILIIINDCELLKDYFNLFYKESYGKEYQITKKKSKHMVISNI